MSEEYTSPEIQELRFDVIRHGLSYFADAVRTSVKQMLVEEGADPDQVQYKRVPGDWTLLTANNIPILKFQELVVRDEKDRWTVQWVVAKDL